MSQDGEIARAVVETFQKAFNDGELLPSNDPTVTARSFTVKLSLARIGPGPPFSEALYAYIMAGFAIFR